MLFKVANKIDTYAKNLFRWALKFRKSKTNRKAFEEIKKKFLNTAKNVHFWAFLALNWNLMQMWIIKLRTSKVKRNANNILQRRKKTFNREHSIVIHFNLGAME